MYKTVIWATDGSGGADAALEHARALAEMSGGRLAAVHCDHRLAGRGGAWPALADEDDRRIKIRRQVADLEADGLGVELVIRRSHKQAADVVAAIGLERNADVIVCGTRGLGAFTGAFLGSFTQRLLHVAPCPLFAVPEREPAEATAKPDKAEIGV